MEQRIYDLFIAEFRISEIKTFAEKYNILFTDEMIPVRSVYLNVQVVVIDYFPVLHEGINFLIADDVLKRENLHCYFAVIVAVNLVFFTIPD